MPELYRNMYLQSRDNYQNLDSQAESCEFDPRRPLQISSAKSQVLIADRVQNTTVTVPQNVPQFKILWPICADFWCALCNTRKPWIIQQPLARDADTKKLSTW